MIYICADSNTADSVTMAFRNRNLNAFTVGRLSQIHLFAKPREVQIAYSGYRDAIEAFVFATITKRKVLTNVESFPLPEDYIPSVPLPLPRLLVKLGGKPNAKLMQMVIGKLEKEEPSLVEMGKGGACIKILQPSWNTVVKLLPNSVNRYCERLDEFSQFGDLWRLLPVYRFIDGFLATNTYPYKKDHYKQGTFDNKRKGAGDIMEMRASDNLWRQGFGSKAPKLQKLKVGDDISRKVDDEEDNDLTPYIDSQVSADGILCVAKPSPLPSSTSYGLPSSVPFVGGLVFPYFSGMMAYDLPGLRNLIAKHCFRCLGGPTEDARVAYKDLKGKLGSVGNTPQGLILAHVLKGIDMSLDSQTQLFLLFDKDEYLGFCLLGDEFDVWAHGEWVPALSAEHLRDELRLMVTSSNALELLCEKFRSMSRGIEDAHFEDLTPEDISTPSELLDVLAKLDLGEDKDRVVSKEIASLISRANMPTKYRAITVENICWALKELTLSADVDFDEDQPVFIPPHNWAGLDSKVYKVLAAFGPRSISFRNVKGEEIRVEKPGSKDYKFEVKDESGKERYPILVYQKAVRECVKDWDAFVASGRFRIDYSERAAGVRAHTYSGENKVELLKCLGSIAGHLSVSKKEELSEKAKGKKRAREDSGDFDEASLMKLWS